jgi:hypothetical protein
MSDVAKNIVLLSRLRDFLCWPIFERDASSTGRCNTIQCIESTMLRFAMRFLWNIWNNFHGQPKTVAHSLGLGEPSRNIFLQRRVNFAHLLRLVTHPTQTVILLTSLAVE